MAAVDADGERVLDEREEALLSSLPEAEGGALRTLTRLAQRRGHVTHAEVAAALPSERLSSDRIEDALGVLAALGVEVAEDDGAEAEEEAAAEGPRAAAEPDEESAGNVAEDAGRSADPVRLYLREMGAMTLLSREGEVALAKRIEAGRGLMIEGLCEAPLVLEAILGWYRAVREERLLLRDVLDLEATVGAGEGPAEEAGGPEDEEAGEGAEAVTMATPSVLEEQVRPEAMAAFEAIEGA